ncbi:Meh1p KNAG_0A06890 [Huiozyma naganishii CBS 8797]|uniref:Uncharacterized protein n=1 Tax=Huiozyma naganishii (strain ATCC MYA-139 / BCRC 22969 / CBS 8797 / KCTC 17520 / NBRC 10181 / NCYC 3082 / Yp74L-3) TaxID=1071383 RepID=J7RFL9_HUIN7|nr:hypothetical protein KNAG_0A06890 [Kazachstania naganishii CBS 8797]CCK68343.1 hypothetical protein KNAG_0A06890 [Kazachstania naganishii CBS 8797]
MGAVLSCCFKNRTGSPDEEALLRGGQNGYGAAGSTGPQDGYDSVQDQLREQELQMRQRDNELKDIVAQTNDKLIDISMVSNSGIVVQSGDLDQAEGSDSLRGGQNSNQNSIQDTTDRSGLEEPQDASSAAGNGPFANPSSAGDKDSQDPKFTALDPSTITKETRGHLEQLYDTMMAELEQQLQVQVPGELTMAF